MKRLLLASTFALFATLPARADFASDHARFGLDMRLGGVALDGDDWKDSVGGFADFGLAFWSADGTIGLWGGVGVQGSTLKWDDGWGPVDTDTIAVPFGGSLFLRGEIAPGVALRLEGGARYVAMDIDDDEWDDHHHHHRRYRDAYDRYYHPDKYLDIDDTAFAIATLQLEFNFDPVFFGIGGGYQFDLCKPDVKYDGEKIFEVDLSGALFFASFGILF